MMSLGEFRFEPQLDRLVMCTFQHFALALIIARRYGVLDLVHADIGDHALTVRNERDQLAVYACQAPA